MQYQIEMQGSQARTRAMFPDLMTQGKLLEAVRLAGF